MLLRLKGIVFSLAEKYCGKFELQSNKSKLFQNCRLVRTQYDGERQSNTSGQEVEMRGLRS